MVTCEALLLTLLVAAPGETVLLDFTASWCGPCRQMQPTVHRLETGGYPVRKIDIDQNRELASRFRVTGVPCFVMLKNGREVDRAVGAVSYARLVQMFDKARMSQAAPAAQVRAQSPEASHQPPTDTRVARRDSVQVPGNDPGSFNANRSTGATSATAQAMNATVRLRVSDGGGHGCGTGTIIDTHGKEALVVTCGHIFRDSKGAGEIEVDLFANGQKRTVTGKVLSYNLDRDIGLVTFSPDLPVTSARVAPAGYAFSPGTRVFSIGCDHGADPSIRQSQITAVDKYLGPPNIEVSGQPVQGRSGGGLFSEEGFLIGICNAADPQDDEGIYASLPTIHWELDRVGQRSVYDRANHNQLAGLTRPAATASSASATRNLEAPPNMPREMSDMMPLPPMQSASGSRNAGVGGPATRGADDTEVICIIRSKNERDPNQRVVVLDDLPVDLLNQIEQAARRRSMTSSIASRARGRQSRSDRDDNGQLIRAQSSD